MVRDQSQYFLKQNLMDLQGSASPSIRAAILAIYQLGEYGDRSSIQMLNDLMVNPQLAASAYTALRKIDARANAVTP
jgi:hypothetical protein